MCKDMKVTLVTTAEHTWECTPMDLISGHVSLLHLVVLVAGRGHKCVWA